MRHNLQRDTPVALQTEKEKKSSKYEELFQSGCDTRLSRARIVL